MNENEKSNVYYEKLSGVIDEFQIALKDGELDNNEIWALVVAINDAVFRILREARPYDEEDYRLVQEAATKLYDKYVKPVDLPGPDRPWDFLLRDVVLPGLIRGIHQLIQNEAT